MLAYRAIVLLLPVALGVPALVSLRRRLAGGLAPGRVLVACAEAD